MSTIRSRFALPILALTLLVLVPCTLAAEEAPATAAEIVLCPAPRTDTEIFGEERLPLASLAKCTAECEDGTTVTCSGSSCSAQDQDCSQDQPGYCISDTEEKFCAACPSEPVLCKSEGNKCVDNDDCPPCSNGDPCACLGGTCACA